MLVAFSAFEGFTKAPRRFAVEPSPGVSMRHFKEGNPAQERGFGVDADGMKGYISESFDGINVAEASGDTFFSYDPDRDLPADRTFPFATIVTGDHYDAVSDLTRPGDYRLNIGLTKATYTSLFGAVPTKRDENGVLETGFDHAVRDQVIPHPIYASQYWVSVVNPGEETLDVIRPMLAEAHEFAVRKHVNQRDRRIR